MGGRLGDFVLDLHQSSNDVRNYTYNEKHLQKVKCTYGSGTVGARVGYSVGDMVLQANTKSTLLVFCST